MTLIKCVYIYNITIEPMNVKNCDICCGFVEEG